ncbi:MAG TPA: hypothetical protein VFV05_02600 [Methylomirabilota bacterium]|nr:hypothetical protein [Methylomirabilota bacterium]
MLAFIHPVDVVFHEAGHVSFGFFGRFLGIRGGSLNQVLIPAVCTGYFLRRGRPAAAVTLFWTGERLTDVAIYVADWPDLRRALKKPPLDRMLSSDSLSGHRTMQ